MSELKRVLFVCIGNACRSQMAESFARAYGSDVLVPSSAGLFPAKAVPPDTLRAMEEKNLDLSGQVPKSLEDLDGVFTYICVSEDALGMAKDELAAKPLVLYEGDDMDALASEEMAIRAVIDHEIDTYDPYEGEVMVWTR